MSTERASSDPADRPTPEPAEHVEEGWTDVESPEDEPRGSFVLLLLFIVAIAATWGYTYYLLWIRG